MKLLSKMIILSVIILSLSKKKYIVQVNKFHDLKRSKICLNIGDKIEFKVSEFTELVMLNDYVSSNILGHYIKSYNTYTAEHEGECYFSFHKKVDEIKKAAIYTFDYFNIFGLKKFLYVKVSKEHEFLESDCDNSRFEIENLSK